MLPLLLAIIALGLSAASLYFSLYGEKQLTAAQKSELLGIATDLQALQNKDITISAPVKTTVFLNTTVPIKEMFPATFDMPLEFEIPIDTQLVGISTTGQPVSFRVVESVPIKSTITVVSSKAFGTSTVRIQKAVPLDVELASNVKIRSAYRQELNSIIDRLDRLAGNDTPTE
jgi:hypothetical protein